MAQKIQVVLDATKLRNLVTKRAYTNKDGQEVKLQEVKFDLVEMKEESQKEVYNAEKYTLVKTHFAVAQQTKEERESNADPFFVGEGISMIWKNDTSNSETKKEETQTSVEAKSEEKDDLPF